MFKQVEYAKSQISAINLFMKKHDLLNVLPNAKSIINGKEITWKLLLMDSHTMRKQRSGLENEIMQKTRNNIGQVHAGEDDHACPAWKDNINTWTGKVGRVNQIQSDREHR